MDILDNQKQDIRDYKEDTTYDTRQTHLEDSFESGTLEIDKDLAERALTAFTSRMDAIKELHKTRNDRINKNYDHYYQQRTINNAQTQQAQGETYLAVEEWADDLVLTFTDLGEHLQLKDDLQLVDEYMVKKLGMKSGEYQKPFSLFKSISDMFNGEKRLTETYYFKRKEIIKNFIKWCLPKSGFNQNSEKYFIGGVISGTFIYKETFDTIEEMKLVMHEKTKDKQYRTLGKVTQEIVKEGVYKFETPDIRNIYCPKDGSWIVEKIETNLYKILAKTFDDNGKELDYPAYDPKQVKQLIKYLKLKDMSVKEKNANINGDNSDNANFVNDVDDIRDIDESDIWSIDGNIDIYEAHYIPMLLEVKGDKGKMVKKAINSMMTFVDVGSDNYLPIQVQPSPYYRLPYRLTAFIPKDDDCFGKGLSEITEKYQETMNELLSFAVDITKGAVWGTTFFNSDVIDPVLMESKDPRRLIEVKGTLGQDIKQNIYNYYPPVEVLGTVTAIIDRLNELFRRLSRKGATGEKMQPNPSATEFESISKELTKGINRTVLRLQDALLDMIKGMYVYTVNYREEKLPLTAEAMRMTGTKDDLMQGYEKGKFVGAEKNIQLDPKELFVDNLGFELTIVNDKEKESVEKQQAMQLVQLLYGTGLVIDPNTGQPKQYQDDSGTAQIIDEYNMLSSLFVKFGSSPQDLWKKQNQTAIPEIPSMGMPQEQSAEMPQDATQQVNAPNAPSIPNLQATPQTGNIAGTAQRIV